MSKPKRFADNPYASVEFMSHDSTGAKIDRYVEKCRYPSMESFLTWFESASNAHSPSKASERANYTHFYGINSIGEAISLARSGWFDPVDETAARSASIFDTITSLCERSVLSYNTEGMQVDIARYLDGEPECWQQWTPTITDGHGTRHIRLLFNCMTSSIINATTIWAKGIAICALVEALEYNHHRVEIIVGAPFKSCELYITVKPHDQPIDMPRLLFTLAHPAMQRRLEFGFMERHPDAKRLIDHNYGGDTNLYWWREPPSEKFDIYIAESFIGEPQWENVNSTVAWCLKVMREQGVHLLND